METLNTQEKAKAADEAMLAMAAQLAEAQEEKDLKTMAEVLGAYFNESVRVQEVSTLLLTRKDQDFKDTPRVVTLAGPVAYVSDVKGDPKQVDVIDDEVPLPIQLISSKLKIKQRVIRKGLVTAFQLMDEASNEVVKKRDERTINLLRASVQAAYEVPCTGGSLTKQALAAGTSLLEDEGLNAKYILMRGSLNADAQDFTNVGDGVADDLFRRGVRNIQFAGANFLNHPACQTTEVLIIPDVEIGHILFETEDKVSIKDDEDLSYKVMAYEESGSAVYRLKVVRITITP